MTDFNVDGLDVFYHAVFEGRRCVKVEVFVMCSEDDTYVYIIIFWPVAIVQVFESSF